MRIRLISLGFVATCVAVAGCGGGGRAKALSMLPNDVEIVVGVDLSRARGTDVWAAAEDVAGAFAKDDTLSAAMDAAEEGLEKFEKETGLDPVQDLSSLVLGYAKAEGGGKPLIAMVFTTSKDLDEDALYDFLEEAEKEDGDSLDKEDVKGVNVYRSDSGKTASFLWDARTLVLGSADWVDEMVDLKTGKKGKTAADKPELAAAVKKVDGSAALWFALATTDEIEDRLKTFPMEGLDDAVDFSGSVLVGKDVNATVRIGFEKKEDAAEVADTAEAFLKVGRKKLKEKLDEVRWAKELLGAYTVVADGKDVVAKLNVSEDVLAGAVKWLKKDGAGMASLLMGGALFGKKDLKSSVMDDDAHGAKAARATLTDAPRSPSYASAVAPSRAPGGGCAAYVACTDAMADAYRKAGWPDAAKSMVEVGDTMSSLTGPSAGTSCDMALASMVKSADTYEKMPKFRFPRAACGLE